MGVLDNQMAVQSKKPGSPASIMQGADSFMQTPPGIAKAMSSPVMTGQLSQPQSIADIRQPNSQFQVQRGVQPQPQPVNSNQGAAGSITDGLGNGAAQAFSSTIGAIKQSSDAAKQAAADGNYGGALGHVARGVFGGIDGFIDDGMRSTAKALDPAANALKTFITGDSAPINQPPVQATPGAKTIADVTMPTGPQSYRPGSATANALNESDSPMQSRAGDPIAPQPAAQKPGRNQDGVITADSAQAAMGNDMQRSGGIYGTMDMKGVNDILARENKARGEMIDNMIAANGGNGIGILADNGNDAANAEKTQRWAIDSMMGQMKNAGSRSERAILGQAIQSTINGQNQLAQEQLRQQGVSSGQQLQMRGQDLGARSDAARLGIEGQKLAIDAPYRAAQTAGQEQANRSAGLLAGLNQRAMAGDAKALETLRAINGKDDSNFMPVTKKVYNDTGQVVGEDVGALDKRTGQSIGLDSSPDKSATASKIQADVQAGKMSRDEAIKKLKAMGYE